MMVSKTVKTYGRLDCAFNNAGIEGEFSRHNRLHRGEFRSRHRDRSEEPCGSA